MNHKIRYSDRLSEGNIKLEKKKEFWVLSNTCTQVKIYNYRKALENFQMWVKMENKRFADW